jgi:hypothetical protein
VDYYANFLTGYSRHTQCFIETGVVPVIIELLQSPVEKVQEQAFFALGSFVGDSIERRDIVLMHNVMEVLQQVLQAGHRFLVVFRF